MILKNRRSIKMNTDKNSSDFETRADRLIRSELSENNSFENKFWLRNLRSSSIELLMRLNKGSNWRSRGWRLCSQWRNKEQRCKLRCFKWLFGIHLILIWFKKCSLEIVMESQLQRRCERQRLRIIDLDEIWPWDLLVWLKNDWQWRQEFRQQEKLLIWNNKLCNVVNNGINLSRSSENN